MRPIGLEPIMPKHGFTIHRDNHSATAPSFLPGKGLEPLTDCLEGNHSTIKLTRFTYDGT